ncbi:tRNA pseudouridine synthase A [bacterium BMS3Abin10]|nr:tRNA pseudouridine synthase A [bacterium BMS3Abin10]GBE38474.1 tRNA pseudouridine synthase A [bacterium BMS3Bbin08]
MRNIKLVIQYDGSGYSGWQVQNTRAQSTEHRTQTTEHGSPPQIRSESGRRGRQNTPADSERIWTQGQAEHPTAPTALLRKAKQWGDAGAGRAQKKITTIQAVLEEAVRTVTGENAKVIAAGRTDAGVHAFDQVAVFRTRSYLEPSVLLRALNANLPVDVRIIKAAEKPAEFHPRYDAKHKTYSYIILPGEYLASPQGGSVFLKGYSWQLPYDLDVTMMRRAARLLIGKHDFVCFRASGCSSKHAVRTIKKISISKTSTFGFMGFKFNVPLIKISVQADAFLRYMVRNIVGTLVEVGKGKVLPEEIKKILRSKDRRLSGPTAPAQGLFLEKIVY